MKLYEISKEMENALLLLESEEETDNEALVEYLDKLEQDYKIKLDNIACMIKNEQAMAEAIENEAKMLLERKKKHDNKALKLKEYVSLFMNQMGLNKLETARNVLSFRKSEVTEVDSEIIKRLYPQLVQRVVVENIPSKTDCKKLFNSGEITQGVKIIEKRNLQVK